ncbi:MAG: gas vesicle protein GvpJ, partial [Halalkalicoccus sp.]
MSSAKPTRQKSDLADVLELVLDKGIVSNADIAATFCDTELLGGEIRASGGTTMSDRDEGVSVLAKQGSITFVGNVVNGVFGFAIVMLMTRFVSPSVYGLFVLATSVILFMQVFANLGLPLAIDYFVPQYLDEGEPGKAKGVIVQVTVTVLVTSSLVALFLAFSASYVSDFFQEPSLQVALLLLSMTIPM